MKLELQKQYPGDKELLIIDTEGHLRICIDYDDVDHETVMREALALIKKVNVIQQIEQLVTTDHETKADFISRVRLCLANIKDHP